ncbi:UNC93-like protein isoform X3 [Bombyx mori]|uniref:UNC93-like protein n=1 Tax=Bombyx mori TaxID=7091 RepID=A0A8R2HTW3_BOMMO|nr:UNC93-like protein isoform X3 [Bombyx mori]XP_037868422.1 UNC93-like protein isoform X3 [Bombyx mori]
MGGSRSRRVLGSRSYKNYSAQMLDTAVDLGAANLQSSINASAGLGTAALAAVYAGLILSNIFLPVFVIKWLGTKWTISFSFLTYMPYIAAQLYPRFYTMIPAGLLVGLGGGPLWCAKCTYLYVMSEAHSAISKITAEALLVRFLGIFFMIFHTSQIWGNLISSLGIYLACMAGAAIIVAVGVDPMKKFDTRGSGSGTGLSGLALLAATLKLLIEPNQILMIPINVFLGFQQAFFGADFTAAFVSCAVGTGSVGFVMMTYGLADAIGCIVNGYIAKIIDRLPLICIATIINIAILTTLLTWHPNGGQAYVLYIIIVVLGFSDSIWIVQINAYYSILFPGREEAAFSNFRLWESVGYIVAYVISPYLRTSVKTYLMLSLLVLGLSCYFTVEYRERRKKSKLNTPDVGCDNFAFQICEK